MIQIKIHIIIAFALSFLSLQAIGADNVVVVADSGSPQIDRLVVALVSRTPAPLPNGGKLPGDNVLADVALLNTSGRCATEDVEHALQKLKAISPKDYRFLVKHNSDDRYSYSMIGPWGSPTISGWINFSIGEAIDAILSNGFSDWLGGYKWRNDREGKGQAPLNFSDYVDARGGLEKWVDSVVAQSRKQIDLDFLDWCIAIEEKRGFEDEESRTEILQRYNAEKKKVESGRREVLTPAPHTTGHTDLPNGSAD